MNHLFALACIRDSCIDDVPPTTLFTAFAFLYATSFAAFAALNATTRSSCAWRSSSLILASRSH